MTLSSLLGRSLVTVPVPTFLETQRWLQERAGVSGGVFERHRSQSEKLVACFAELHMLDADALAFCKQNVDTPRFWIEWEIYGESGAPNSQHMERCAFLSNLVAGRPTAIMNLPRPKAPAVS